MNPMPTRKYATERFLSPIDELNRYGLHSKFRTIHLFSPMTLLFQIREYRPGVRKVILIHGKKKIFFPYVIFIRNRITGTLHVCFSEDRIRSRFSKVYSPDRLVSNIICNTEVCLGYRRTKRGNISSRFSLKKAIERFWWSPFDFVQFHPSSLDNTITNMRRKSSKMSLWVFFWMCLNL
jgi:hypothetical protein